ncbi:MAG TPA: HypC/HybG/HupF family hydrogenase formation chaperone [Polyangiaceae bacterium]|nr:HypC/HybG/HupF family hydrogenase formation chaperone [Polyangiaceae bacterium]
MCLAVPGELLESYDREGMKYGRVRFGSVTREVCLYAFPDALKGEFLLVHVGFAIARIDRVEAERTLSVLLELEQGDAFGAIEPSAAQGGSG